MTIDLQPLIALIAGILILIIPRILNYIVAIYLIIIGIIVTAHPDDGERRSGSRGRGPGVREGLG